MADFYLAEFDIKKALEIDPDNRKVKLEYKVFKEKVKEYNKKDAKFYGNMFAKLNKLEPFSSNVSIMSLAYVGLPLLSKFAKILSEPVTAVSQRTRPPPPSTVNQQPELHRLPRRSPSLRLPPGQPLSKRHRTPPLPPPPPPPPSFFGWAKLMVFGSEQMGAEAVHVRLSHRLQEELLRPFLQTSVDPGRNILG
ncbi:PREDICTED: uncharacterized protein LOC109183990 [Ipomoea nil]|uniref:uncharacterized protein LOC109183990 n=1 Tax=Ipomoea nil TaxID=35883 RepID=UPI000901B05F|nr:PREDICTED: uncharacterized protein LOC109183990 [Ipomoea nil]